MIEATDIHKRFGTIAALKGVSFFVNKGEAVGFLGPNGAGKTTAMRILSCFMPPTSGKASVAGLDVTRHSLRVRQKIGYAMERTSFYPEMRVIPFLRYVGALKGIAHRDLKGRICEVLSLCGLEKVTHRLIGNLSKGYRQRLALAQALINRPEVLILDEPTVGLDPENVSGIRRLIKGLTGDRTILLSSHILSEVSMICSKVIIMKDGRVQAVDTPARLGMMLQDSGAVDIDVQCETAYAEALLKQIPGVQKVYVREPASNGIMHYRLEFANGRDIFPALNRLAAENHWVLRKISPVTMTLEDIFLKIVSKQRYKRSQKKARAH